LIKLLLLHDFLNEGVVFSGLRIESPIRWLH
jgi:hypothetical protein